jgi:hypothetical protein
MYRGGAARLVGRFSVTEGSRDPEDKVRHRSRDHPMNGEIKSTTSQTAVGDVEPGSKRLDPRHTARARKMARDKRSS